MDPIGFATDAFAGEDKFNKNVTKNVRDFNAGTGPVLSQTSVNGVDDATQQAMGAAQQAMGEGEGIMRGGLGYGAQSRGDQDAATAQLQAAAAGAVPSAAEIQMQQGTQQALRAQLAAANSGRGGTGAQLQAALGAQQQGAQMSAQAVQNASALRAQEMATARGALSQHLGAVRGADLQTAGLGADYAQGQGQLALGQGQLATQQGQFANDFWLDQEKTWIDRDLGVARIDADLERAAAEDRRQRREIGLGAITGGFEAGARAWGDE